MNPETTGKKIAAMRRARNLTQKELADAIHVTDKAVSKWERGLNFPDLKTLEPLAAALDTTVVALLGLEQATRQETVETISAISARERAGLLRELRGRAVLKIVIECILLSALIWASNIFESHGLYGLPQSLTGGMSGFVGVLIGSEIYFLRKCKKL